jgi:hypothetical protein
MTLASDTGTSNRYNKEQFERTLKVLNKIVDYLGTFEGYYDRKFNFSKLADLFNIPQSQIDEIVHLLLNFQEKFETVFKKYQLQKYRASNQVYLITEKRSEYKVEVPPEVIEITSSHIKLLNDIIYVFKHVKRGYGFDIVKNGTDLSAKVKELKATHSYLFESKGNGVVYPTELAQKLGELIISYNKSNKSLENVTIDNHTITVIKDS